MTNASSKIVQSIGEPIQKELEQFDGYFRKQMKSNVALLDVIVRYILKSRGKQLRPTLVFLSAGLCGSISERTFVGASMVELLHTATLVHDDVVDSAEERRGLASINAVWKNKVAVLVGDFLLSRGLLSAVEHNEFAFLAVTSRAVRRMSEGELLQIQKSRQRSIDEETYYRIISDKTASLISTCCEIGAISSTDDSATQMRMQQFGEQLGLAFQIRDDVLDYTSRSLILGKPVGNDVREGKLTLPLIYAMQQSRNGEVKKVLNLVKSKKANDKEVAYVHDFVQANGGNDYAQRKAQELADRSISLLSDFADSPYKQSLLSFANYVVSREK